MLASLSLSSVSVGRRCTFLKTLGGAMTAYVTSASAGGFYVSLWSVTVNLTDVEGSTEQVALIQR